MCCLSEEINSQHNGKSYILIFRNIFAALEIEENMVLIRFPGDNFL